MDILLIGVVVLSVIIIAGVITIDRCSDAR